MSARLKTVQSPTIDFAESANTVVGELQAALAELLASIPGGASRAVDIERTLGLDKKRGWQLYRIATAATPLSEIANIPGTATMRRILAAAAKKNMPPAAIERAASAYKLFEAFVDENIGDRAELISLASGLSPADVTDPQQEISIRRSLYRGLAHAWGIKAETITRTVIFNSHPTEPLTENMLGVLGNVGLQRLRRDVPLSIGLYVGQAMDESAEGPPLTLARSTESSGMRILEEFSSQPPPVMEPRVKPNGLVETNVLFPPSGKSGAVTFFGTQFVKDLKTAETHYSTGALIRIPCKKMVCELLVPQGLSKPETLRASVYGRRDHVEQAYEQRPEDLLPQREHAQYLGVLETAPPIPGVLQHPEIIRRAVASVGWTGTRFDVYRCVVEYPLLHTLLALNVDVTNHEKT